MVLARNGALRSKVAFAFLASGIVAGCFLVAALTVDTRIATIAAPPLALVGEQSLERLNFFGGLWRI